MKTNPPPIQAILEASDPHAAAEIFRNLQEVSQQSRALELLLGRAQFDSFNACVNVAAVGATIGLQSFIKGSQSRAPPATVVSAFGRLQNQYLQGMALGYLLSVAELDSFTACEQVAAEGVKFLSTAFTNGIIKGAHPDTIGTAFKRLESETEQRIALSALLGAAAFDSYLACSRAAGASVQVSLQSFVKASEQRGAPSTLADAFQRLSVEDQRRALFHLERTRRTDEHRACLKIQGAETEPAPPAQPAEATSEPLSAPLGVSSFWPTTELFERVALTLRVRLPRHDVRLVDGILLQGAPRDYYLGVFAATLQANVRSGQGTSLQLQQALIARATKLLGESTRSGSVPTASFPPELLHALLPDSLVTEAYRGYRDGWQALGILLKGRSSGRDVQEGLAHLAAASYFDAKTRQ